MAEYDKEVVARKHARLDKEIEKLQSLVDKLKENQANNKNRRARYANGIRFSASIIDIFSQLELISQLYHQSPQMQKEEYIRGLSNYVTSVLRRPELSGGFLYLQVDNEFNIRSLVGKDLIGVVYYAITCMVDELIQENELPITEETIHDLEAIDERLQAASNKITHRIALMRAKLNERSPSGSTL
jgi:hypothetical protein